MFKRIILAYDGSATSKLALNLLLTSLKPGYDSEIYVTSVFSHIPDYLSFDDASYEELVAKATVHTQHIADEAVATLNEAGYTAVETEVLDGPAYKAILSVSEAREADLILMGSRGLSDLSGMLLGSTSHRVVRRATCPVLIAR
ncbi:MAG: universal stress protein [Chloroflexi bacterium]|nr:MAG: universal stress protein [Chloroflexota bacterium]